MLKEKDYKTFNFRVSRADSDVINILESKPNMSGYIRDCIRKDNINTLNGYKSLEYRAKMEKAKLSFAEWIVDNDLESLLLIEYYGFDVVLQNFLANCGNVTLDLISNAQFQKDTQYIK